MKVLPAPAMPAWIAAMLPADIQRFCVTVGAYRMHVMERGSGRPVLMLHGNPTWGFLYRKVAAALAGEPLRLIIPDLIGLGFSEKPRSMDEHRLERHGRWIGELIDALDLRDLIFVGQDWGGPIGLRALHDRADRVAGMVILNTVVGPPKPKFRATAFHRFSRMPVLSDVAFRLGGFPQNALALVQGDRRSLLGKVGRAYRYPLRHLRDRVAPLALARMVPDSHEHHTIPELRVCEDFVRAYQGPAAIVWGERDPVLGRVLGHIRTLFPQAPVTRTRAGHFLQEEVPDEIAAAIRLVAAQIDAGPSERS
jgi:pimeloyl-ACP methyl ester carboxylesterase